MASGESDSLFESGVSEIINMNGAPLAKLPARFAPGVRKRCLQFYLKCHPGPGRRPAAGGQASFGFTRPPRAVRVLRQSHHPPAAQIHERLYSRQQLLTGSRGRSYRQAARDRKQTLNPELLARFVTGFADAVGIQEQQVTHFQLHGGLAVGRSFDNTKRQVNDLLAIRRGIAKQAPLSRRRHDTTGEADGRRW